MNATRLLALVTVFQVVAACSEKGTLGVARSAALTSTLSPSAQTIDENTAASWIGTIAMANGSDGAPVYVAWDFEGDGTDDLVLCDDAGSTHCSDYCLRSSLTSTAALFTTGLGADGLVIADVNTDGNLDVVNGDTSQAAISVLLGDGQGSLGAHMEYATGGIARQVVAADFNHDTAPDLVVVTEQPFEVRLGAGDGSFSSSSTYGAGSGACISDAVIGFIDGDSEPDLAVINECSRTISIFLGSAIGVFTAKGDVGTGIQPWSIALADFNNDGKLDAMVADRGEVGSVSVVLGNGDGTFGNYVQVPVAAISNAVATGDFDGDGFVDAVVAVGTKVSVLLGNGNGTFATHVDYDPGGPVNATQHPLAVADVDGDGFPDVVSALLPTGISVLGGRGDGTFRAPVVYATAHEPENVEIADLDSDGVSDVVATQLNLNDGYVSVHRGTPTISTCVVDAGHVFPDVAASTTYTARLTVRTSKPSTLHSDVSVTVNDVSASGGGGGHHHGLCSASGASGTPLGCWPFVAFFAVWFGSRWRAGRKIDR